MEFHYLICYDDTLSIYGNFLQINAARAYPENFQEGVDGIFNTLGSQKPIIIGIQVYI